MVKNRVQKVLNIRLVSFYLSAENVALHKLWDEFQTIREDNSDLIS